MRKYKCGKCKDTSFKTRFKLTEHLKRCKKGLRVPGADGKVPCPECKGKIKYLGLGAHRFSAHGVKGSSRWARKSQRQKAAQQANKTSMEAGPTLATICKSIPPPSLTLIKRKGLQPALDGNEAVAQTLLDKAAQHRHQAAGHLVAAERLTKMAAELKEMTS